MAASYRGDTYELKIALRLIDDLIYYAHATEAHNNVLYLGLLDEAEKAITQFASPDKAASIRKVFAGVAAANHLQPWILSKLKSTPTPKNLAADMLRYSLYPCHNQIAIELQDIMKHRIPLKSWILGKANMTFR